MSDAYRTYKCDQVVEEDQGKADDGKIEQVSPVSPLRLQTKLVIDSHDTSSHKVRQRAASENDEDILRDEAPWRVAGSEESRLFGRQHAHVVGPVIHGLSLHGPAGYEALGDHQSPPEAASKPWRGQCQKIEVW